MFGQIGPFESSSRGFAEGAKFFFKNVEDLNAGEISLLVGLIKSVGFYFRHIPATDRALVRQGYVLQPTQRHRQNQPDIQVQQALYAPIRLAQPPTAAIVRRILSICM